VTVFGTFPEITEPDLVIELATITVILGATVAGGGALLPGSVLHMPPQAGGLGVITSAKPLNAAGAAPPLTLFSFDHCALQNVTC
jgi:hypothetical protein